jgi:transposase
MENQMRPIALGRKNYLFAGSPDGARRAALFYSLLSCCQLNGINPNDYMYDVLSRIGNHPVNRLDELLPDQWQPLNKTGEDGQNLQR